ncbi:single-stranded-DNA-specific exonuclease RecJ [Eggerthellaceae bacterium zg-887]|uniref:single-stranded-DNA-specific exonuclease RecJ n=1 Tax=Xiamenia xianingshaonis TaxID=2682776 RepID=UPI00140E04F1|nr:single-stranded-DNA-specific exonuclease RecJ [Xiamenia xianingshaonis]NHM16292.1 single-stranded-DNA-specific exonuclease RecJ [Xiamenia xianingshaonis]
MAAQFSIRPADGPTVSHLQKALGLPRFLATTLVARGFTDEGEAMRFLNPSFEQDWHNPYDIPGMADVVDVIEQAIRADESILVFGDFDLDGISATTVLTRALRVLGAKVTPFIPRRFDEGYGLSAAALERAKTFAPDLIVTVDCGIACKDEVAYALDQGFKVAVTDHHEASDAVPTGVPLADPKCEPNNPSSVLAGVGVVLKVVQAVGARFGQPHLWRNYTDLATLGTVADLMPMVGENRSLVLDGLRRINDAPRPCIAALLAVSGSGDKAVTSTNLSFSLVPRLNAAGRMGDADLAIDLLMSDDFDEASRLAAQLEATNDQRRAIESELSEIAQAQAEKTYHGQRALVVAGEGWHEGVKGIVASRLVNLYGVPSLLFTIDGDEARGSGRSVGTINLFKAVESAADLLTRFGGHEAAVGVTIPAKNLPEFERRLCAYMDALPEEAFHPVVEIDAVVDLDEMTLENVDAIERLAPFGQENKTPLLLARDVTVVNGRAVGAGKNHFSCSLSNGRDMVSAIMFHCSTIEELMRTDSVVNAAFEAQVDQWRGRRTVKAMVKVLEPAFSCACLDACMEACGDSESLSQVKALYEEDDEALCADAVYDSSTVRKHREALSENRAFWEQKAASDPEGLEQAIIKAIIGDRKLHDAQRRILDALNRDESVLGIMVTGRGKSLTFQVHAAMRALSRHEASLFVYPLRALIADQAFHLRESLGRFGVRVRVLMGENSPEERERGFAALVDGTCDIVLTTPEFLAWHADEFAASRRIAFAVVDEAHHIGMAKAGQREAYATIGSALRKLGSPTVLALTATADDEVAEAIERELPIQTHVFDTADRPNLHVDDCRNMRHRDNYLATIVASGEKTVIYVNSREQSVAVARMLRRKVPQLGLLIGFYNAGLSRAERKRIEELFRSGALTVLVATSAFGEGIDIPDIRHVVLYHLPFNEIEFNQMSGRAGRDGKDAWIHLLFGRADCSINERILHDMTPDHDCMAQVYRGMRALQRTCAQPTFTVTPEALAAAASTELFPVSPAAVNCGVAVFRELGLIETTTVFSEEGSARTIRVVETTRKVNLTDSVRYREGLDERSVFHDFRDWAMSSDCASLNGRVSNPILPSRMRARREGGRVGGPAEEAL